MRWRRPGYDARAAGSQPIPQSGQDAGSAEQTPSVSRAASERVKKITDLVAAATASTNVVVEGCCRLVGVLNIRCVHVPRHLRV
jgi:hypothetical protein